MTRKQQSASRQFLGGGGGESHDTPSSHSLLYDLFTHRGVVNSAPSMLCVLNARATGGRTQPQLCAALEAELCVNGQCSSGPPSHPSTAHPTPLPHPRPHTTVIGCVSHARPSCALLMEGGGVAVRGGTTTSPSS